MKNSAEKRKTQSDTTDGVMTGRQILDGYSNGIALYKNVDGDLPDVTLSKCKDYLGAKLVINNEFDEITQHSNTIRLIFAHIIRCKNLGINANLDFDRLPDDYAESMFTTVTRYTKRVRDGIVSDALGIDVDGLWKFYTQNTISTVSAIRNIPVRLLYAHSYNNCVIQYGYESHLDHKKGNIKEKNKLVKLITQIDQASNGKNICLGIMKSYYKNYTDETTVESVIVDTALDILINMYDDIKDVSEKMSSALNFIFNSNILNRDNSISGHISCNISQSTLDVIVTLDMQSVKFHDKCLLAYIMRRVTKNDDYYISSVNTDVRKCVMTVTFSC